jgi:hypothetical protein
MVMKTNDFDQYEILEILKKKELRKPICRESIIGNLEISTKLSNQELKACITGKKLEQKP